MNTAISTEESLARFLGDRPYQVSGESARMLGELRERGVVWITELSKPPFLDIRRVAAGRSILALGSLEGNLEWTLAAAGAKRVVGVEGYEANYRKCLLLKELFPSLPLEFVFGDIEQLELAPEFDMIVCPGVLYHLRDPVRVLSKLRALDPERFFLSTQLAVNPPHPAFAHYRLGDIGDLAGPSGRYFGRWCPDRRGGRREYRAGLHDQTSFWFFPGDLHRLLGDLHFHLARWSVADLDKRGVVTISELRTSRH